MTVSPGRTLGPYEIIAPLGAGGMGEVYRARDTRLDREVAVKVLPARLTESAEFKQRFEREARVISNLTHPNICTLYDIGDEDGVDYLVMEYLDGETLAQRISRGPLPLDDVLRIGAEIAAALDRAHRAGVVHRDLKPGNVMLTKSGTKLLDFGLVKRTTLLASDPGASTVSEPLTGKGTIVGTFQYMAPEQLEGKEADARTDVFAFGALLYEMATGRRAFAGDSRASLIASIMSSQPRAVSEVQPMTPPALEHLVRMCLAKDPDDRIQTAHDVKLQLQWIAEGGSQVGTPAVLAVRRKSKERLRWLTTVTLLIATVVLGMAYVRNATGAAEMITAAIRPPADVRFVFTDDAGGPAVISPNGRAIAFTGRGKDGVSRLWVSRLDDGSARVLPGTEGCYFPFWSPDSESVAFFAKGQLKRVSVAGGQPVTLCTAPLGKGGDWTPDGEILFAPDFDTAIFRVPESGGAATAVTQVGEGSYTTHRWPLHLPDGRHFLYFAGNHDLSQRKDDGVFFASLDGAVNKLIVKTRGNAAYAAGQLLYLRNDTLMAQPFDARRGELSGSPTPIAYNVQYDGAVWRGVFSASDTGVLIYQTGLAPSGTTLTWFDRTGKDLGNLGEQAVYGDLLRFSPDGARVVASVGDPADVWAFELARGMRTRITTDPVDERPVIWSPDGTKVVYTSRNRPDKRKILYMKPSGGSGPPSLLYEDEEEIGASDCSPDGKYLLLRIERTDDQTDVGLLTLGDEPKLLPLLSTPFNEDGARFSPDGRWIAYASNESGREEVYVIPFCGALAPDGTLASCGRSGRWQISTNGGTRPVWAHGGTKLYFQALDRTLYEVAVDVTGDSFEARTPKALFTPDAAVANLPGQLGTGYGYDVTPDGERFLVNTFGSGDATPLTLVLNWTKMVRQP